MAAEGRLSHVPTEDWACFTPVGFQGENLSTSAGPRAVFRYMQDSGDNNLAVGHRLQILSPEVGEIGTSDVAGRYRFTNAMHFSYNREFPIAAREPRGFVAWPPAGHVSTGVVWGRWSFQLPGGDFSQATVTVRDSYGPVLARIINRRGAIVWAVHGDNGSRPLPGPVDDDVCYVVTISKVRIGGAVQTPFEYATCIVDAIGYPRVAALSDARPVWSRDGTSIVYRSEPGVWSVNADGTGQRFLSFFDMLVWSPDGTRFFARSRHRNVDGQRRWQRLATTHQPGPLACMVTGRHQNGSSRMGGE